MKKYTTKPIDFTGCHPVIAEALKRHEEIKCMVWDSDCDSKRGVETWICWYKGNSKFPYSSDSYMSWRYAEPIPIRVKRIMPPERAIPVLIANGWRFDNQGVLSGGMYCIVPQMFEKMGKPLEDNSWQWPPCIIEEV